jgi:response regulator RpfG family c-di-GMP phosphodiesterase
MLLKNTEEQAIMPLILIVDHDATRSCALSVTLQAAGYAVATAVNGFDGLRALARSRPALVLVAWNLPFIDGAIFIEAVRAGLAQPPPIIALIDGPCPDHPGIGPDLAVLPYWPATDLLLATLADRLGPSALPVSCASG